MIALFVLYLETLTLYNEGLSLRSHPLPTVYTIASASITNDNKVYIFDSSLNT